MPDHDGLPFVGAVADDAEQGEEDKRGAECDYVGLPGGAETVRQPDGQDQPHGQHDIDCNHDVEQHDS